MAGKVRSRDRLLLALVALVAAAFVLGSLWVVLAPGPGGAPTSPERPQAGPTSPARAEPASEAPAATRGTARAPAQASAQRLDAEAPLSADAPRLAVRVCGSPALPLPGAEVSVYLTGTAGGGERVGRLETDVEGRCSLEIGALAGVHLF